jgi:spastin
MIDQPDEKARSQLLNILLAEVKHDIQPDERSKLVKKLGGFFNNFNILGYSASDIKAVIKEACMEPVRNEIGKNLILTVQKNDIRAVCLSDFEKAMKNIRPTLTPKDLEGYKVFDKLRGKVEK